MPSPGASAALRGRKDYFPGASFGADFTRGRYKLGKRQARNPASLPGWTFTRASTGYAETAAGALVAFASGAPRITDKGLLVEEARTNLCLQSQTFGDAAWTKGNCAITADAVLAPDGTLTADTVTVSTTASASLTIAGGYRPAVTGTTCTASVYVKRGATIDATASFVLRDATGAADKITGALTWATMTMTGTGASITRLGSTDWYRVVLTDSAWTSTNQAQLYAGMAGSSYTIGHAYAVWGAQIEAGAFPTSYIPTTTASATRAADVATITGLSIPAPFTLVAEYVKNGEGTTTDFPRALSLEGATIEHSLFQRDSTQAARVFVTSTVELTIGTGSLGAISKLAGRFETNNVNGAFNGTAGTADTTATVQTGVSAYFGTAASVNPMLGYIRRAFIYPYAFTDAQLQAATA